MKINKVENEDKNFLSKLSINMGSILEESPIFVDLENVIFLLLKIYIF